MVSKQFSQVIRSNGNKTTANLGKRIKKMHGSYDAQLHKAKSKARLRQIYLKHRRDHQKLLQQHLKEEASTIKRLGKMFDG